MKTIVETERLCLREMTEADAHNVYLLNHSRQVTKYLGEPVLTSQDEALEILRSRIFPQYRDYGIGRWAVLLRQHREFIGWCGLKYLPGTNEYDLGFRFLESSWGNGYATEAARAVLDYCRPRLAGRRIVATVLVANQASIRVLEKMGMRCERFDHDHDGPVAVYSCDEGSGAKG
jgi:RimJ/RimL family protein N-acetyltransferase